jgi:hypothetical protein
MQIGNMLKLYEFNKPKLFRRMYKMTCIHLNPTTGSAEKVNLAPWVMSHTVAASLNASVATGKDHCFVCYELHSVVNEVIDECNEG